MKINFIGKSALILGATSELGLSLSNELIKEGFFLFLTKRDKIAKEKIKRAIKNKEQYKLIDLNLENTQEVKNLFSDITKLDYIIDLSQTNLEALIADANDEDVEKYFNMNISSKAKILKSASKIMLKNKKGRMIYISSLAAFRSNPGQGFYAASKLANEALYKNIGIEFLKKEISTIALRFAYIDAGRGKAFLKDNKEILKKQIITKKEATDAILFFMSKELSIINANNIIIDKGFSSKK